MGGEILKDEEGKEHYIFDQSELYDDEKMGEKLENIQYTDPKCSILEVSFLTEDGRLDKEVITYNELY
jgi:hypothetical protein